MATVRPFRALRYAASSDLAPLLAPPYDVINAAEQAALYDRDPQNVIRLEYGTTSSADTPADNRYTRANATLDAWLADGTLALEDAPAFYPHTQRYTWSGEARARSGFFAAVRLRPFEAGEILPHERTLTGPKADRLQLMRACQASFSPVFGLFDGAHTELPALLARARAGAPVAAAQGHGFDETLWRSSDPGLNAAISAALSTRQLLIADGHHRYETLLAMRDELCARYPDAPETAGFHYAMLLLVDLHDPGLLVLPTHRLLLLTPEMTAAFCRVAGLAFSMEQVAVAHPDQVPALLATYRDQHAFLWYTEGRYTLLTSPRGYRNGLPVLDVQALQERLTDPLFALDPDGQASVEANIRYTVHPADAVARVDRGEVDAAIFLNPTPVADVFTLAGAGIRLPQKSTYFYPKVPTGLTMLSLRPDVEVG
ncbi:MAG TPA: DUF1015 domain-containing protein [Armatimonadota bacterium]|nr:DUF1015 domain-containing protein [Armatimonadota bacterium]